MIIKSYSFCEASTAGSASRWHIRPLTSAGKKLGGGADTSSLCGIKVSWDIKSEISPDLLEDACFICRQIYKETFKEVR